MRLSLYDADIADACLRSAAGAGLPAAGLMPEPRLAAWVARVEHSINNN